MILLFKFVGGDFKVAEWKKLSSEELGISTSMISKPTRVVLKELKKNGNELFIEIQVKSLV